MIDRVFQAYGGRSGGPHRSQQLQEQGGVHWHYTSLQIGKRARRLPLCQQRHLCVDQTIIRWMVEIEWSCASLHASTM